MDDPYNLQRFIEAQSQIIDQVYEELRAGRKRSHWMWFVFPQIQGLGRSFMAQFAAISSREEAVAFLKHPVLGPRLRECTVLVNQVENRSAQEIFGSPDNLKFQASMTLFAQVTADNAIFVEALRKYCGGEFDSQTMELLGR